MFDITPDDDGIATFIDRCNDAAAATRAPLNAGGAPGKAALVALQPHADDMALSVGGVLARVAANLVFLTIFGGSREFGAASPRESEDAELAQLLDAGHYYLDFPEHKSSEQLPDIDPIARVVQARVLAQKADAILLAPIAVARHPDHRVVQRIAEGLGCGVFWEDVAFWGIYASSVEDRTLFSLRSCPSIARFTLIAVDISSHIWSKAMMLGCYRSQSTEVWRPLRYAWAAAREIGAPFDYCERLFVCDDHVANVQRLLGSRLVRGRTIQYGASWVRTGWIGET
jgi:LmbE family N-acetylglucosaminyl deacetylase